jgi:hypothetical protein
MIRAFLSKVAGSLQSHVLVGLSVRVRGKGMSAATTQNKRQVSAIITEVVSVAKKI